MCFDNNGRIIKEDPKLATSNRFTDLCRNAVEISSIAAQSNEASRFFAKKMFEASIEVDKILTSLYSSDHHDEQGEEANAIEKNIIQVKGMKKKDGSSRVKGAVLELFALTDVLSLREWMPPSGLAINGCTQT
ncbi:protein FAR1-RELATED SEQUENCE 5-like [Senna tora]|uniref:Protein FAR1-RELATED SEQUENCE 5-like n=1 Tax=Senna tora TaxID=362788 RepID=A0A834XH17_9FABA|nr:protein FAR1-RELATED SEQUENCE 5-like [Senna tora]